MAETQVPQEDIVKELSKRITGKPTIGGRPLAITGMAAETKLPNEEGKQLERTLDERFERGEMFRILKRLRKKRAAAVTNEERKGWQGKLITAQDIFNSLRNKLDILNRQYYSPEYTQMVGVEVLGEQVEIPVRRYSLRDSDKTQLDGQIPPPIFIIGGITSGPTVTKSTAEAYALQYPNRDVYVIGYPNSKQSRISPDLPKKLKEQGDLTTFTKINKDVLLKLGFENFDLVGISMGGGIVLRAATDTKFAKKINNLIVISPTSVQETRGRIRTGLGFIWETFYSRIHPKQWLRVPQIQPGGYDLGFHKDMGAFAGLKTVNNKALAADDFAGIHINGRVIIGTGSEDALISCEQIKKETTVANEKRAANGERPIEFMQVQGGHHYLGDVYAAGIVALIRNTKEMPEQIYVKRLPATTAEVFVREDPRLAPVADQILKR